MSEQDKKDVLLSMVMKRCMDSYDSHKDTQRLRFQTVLLLLLTPRKLPEMELWISLLEFFGVEE